MKLQNIMSYQAFGFNIVSEIDLPELQQGIVSNVRGQITISINNLSEMWSELSDNCTGPFVVSKEYIMFRVEGVAIFLIKDGNAIVVSPLQPNREDEIRLYILGTCMGAILLQNNILPLHGSVLSIDGKAYGIVGECGAGKSTLARAFIKKGYKLLSDDLIPVTFINNIPQVIPSYPYQKLWEESLAEFNMKSENYLPIVYRESKYSVPMEDLFESETIPLAGIFVLNKQDGDNIELKELNSINAIQVISEHTYRNFLIQRLGLLNWHFQLSAKIIENIQVFKLVRPTSRFTANELTDVIIKEINGGKSK